MMHPFFYRMLDVRRAASYKITLVHLSVWLSIHQSVCPSLSFLKDGSLVFSDIVHGDSCPGYIVTDEARVLKKKKKICCLNLGPISLNHAQNEVFCHFLEFGSLVFLEIGYHDNFQQCLTSSR